MPYAVTHVLIAIVIAEIIRDYFVKDKKHFPLHYVLIAGIAGLLPDIDILLYLAVGFISGISPAKIINNLSVSYFHPSFTHSLLWVPIILAFALIFLWLEKRDYKRIKNIEKTATRHHLRISGILFMIALGVATHFLLDFLLGGYIRILFFSSPIGLFLIPSTEFGSALIQGIDAMLLILWLAHEEWKHKISSFL